MRTSLLKLGVYTPQLLLMALGMGLEMVLQQVGILSTWALPLVVLAGLASGLAFVTTMTKASRIQRDGWGQFDGRLETTCARCCTYQTILRVMGKQLDRAEQTLLDLTDNCGIPQKRELGP